MKRFKASEDIAITDLLLHSMQYLDAAAQMAEDNQDAQMMLKVFDKSLKASDRLISIILHAGNEGEIIDGTEQGSFGFSREEPAESQREFEARSK